MQTRAVAIEEERREPTAPIRTNQSRVLSCRVFQLLPLILFIGLVFSFLGMLPANYFVFRGRTGTRSSVTEFEETSSIIRSLIRPPSNLLHDMNDTELFWRASFVPRVRDYPFKRVPKIAFMFLTKGPLPLAPLWERLFRGHEGLYSIYIHSHPSYVANFPPTSVFYKRQIPS
ncbi:hypothetical protein CRG98_017305 [Punica granatum]|uniref:Uncharacterized protein n=1 Tax=Punica granatum TaxID=22663 RepID=A0A2I0K174_PUNGR|nr:hypothetical protein CRG98_017305 [Punica granatum]